MSSDVFKSVPFHPVIVQWFQQHFATPSPPQTKGWPSIAAGKHTLILAPTGSGKTLAAFLWSIDQLLRRFIAENSGKPFPFFSGVHLSLSLERLMPLCEKEPLRIGLSATQKPLQRIAAFLGGQQFSEKAQRFIPREVTSIDCGQRKNLDLKVITPVRSFNELPDSSVWEPVYQMLYDLICRHQTTLVFANMRAQTEKIARQLNDIHRRVTGDPGAEVALAHHGSISREARYEIEARLKAGKIPAVVATASLELGIDIGSIDLVVQLETPRTISGALQRVGRSGHFAGSAVQVLKARLRWDKVNNRLIARRGSRLTALMNGGTIPDRGYFAVYLINSNVKLGEMEEEFVFESRVGEVFFLGNSEWRIDSIDQSRIIVTPVAAIKPKAPFWKGDILFRDHATSSKIGQFRRKLLGKLYQENAQKWLIANYLADPDTAENLVTYFQRQRQHLPAVPTDRQFVVETSVNADGIPILVLHAPLGARVNGAWAIALAAMMEQHYGMQVQYSFDDDGMFIRLPDGSQLPPLAEIFKRAPAEYEARLIAALPDSPIFAVQFRYNAARALLLPRTQAKKRIPLWLQRLRAADLREAIEAYRDFPLIVETYRDCLQDKLDLSALKKVLRDLNAGKIRLTFATTRYPSPMAANVLYKFVASHLYEMDQNRRSGQKKDRHQGFLSEILQTAPVIFRTSNWVPIYPACSCSAPFRSWQIAAW